MKLANLVAMYRVMKSFFPMAFERKESYQSEYNAFVKANLTNNLVALTKQEAAAGACVVAPYKVSEGSLTPIELTTREGGFSTNVSVGALSLDSETTIADFSAALVENNNGIEYGDQLSFVQLIQQTSDVTGNPYAVMRKYEVTLSDSTANVGDYLPLDLIGTDSGVLVVNESAPVGGIFFALSRKSGSKILVSTQYIVMDTTQYYDLYTTAAQRANAIHSYGQSNDVFLSPETQNEAPAVTPETTLSILTAKLNSGNFVAAGGYLGTLTPAQGGTIYVNFNTEIEATTVGVQVIPFGGSPLNGVGASASGSQVTANLPSYSGSSAADVQYVVVTLDGVEYTATFGHNPDGATE